MRCASLAVLLLVVTATPAAEPAVQRPLAEVLAGYIREALEANLALRSQGFDVERELALLDEARSRFLPRVDLDARYSWADGGREIAFAGTVELDDAVDPDLAAAAARLQTKNASESRFT